MESRKKETRKMKQKHNQNLTKRAINISKQRRIKIHTFNDSNGLGFTHTPITVAR